jgi:hypothetical protein
MSIKHRRVNTLASHARFAVVSVCIMVMVWALSSQAMVNTLASEEDYILYTIVGKCSYSTGPEVDCGSMVCTLYLMRANKCQICTDKLVKPYTAFTSCGDEKVFTSSPADAGTPKPTTEQLPNCTRGEKTEAGELYPQWCLAPEPKLNCVPAAKIIDPSWNVNYICCPWGHYYDEKSRFCTKGVS